MSKISAEVRRISDDEFELYWEGGRIAATTKTDVPIGGNPEVPGDFAVELVDYAEVNGYSTELLYIALGGVNWTYNDER